jgi:hypothetical protein
MTPLDDLSNRINSNSATSDEEAIRAEALRVLNDVPAHELLQIVSRHGSQEIANRGRVLKIKGRVEGYLKDMVFETLQEDCYIEAKPVNGNKSRYTMSEWQEEFGEAFQLLEAIANSGDDFVAQCAQEWVNDINQGRD